MRMHVANVEAVEPCSFLQRFPCSSSTSMLLFASSTERLHGEFTRILFKSTPRMCKEVLVTVIVVREMPQLASISEGLYTKRNPRSPASYQAHNDQYASRCMGGSKCLLAKHHHAAIFTPRVRLDGLASHCTLHQTSARKRKLRDHIVIPKQRTNGT